MYKEEIKNIIESGKIEEHISELEEQIRSEYDERLMYILSVVYLASGYDSKAKKLAKKLRTLFPSGDLYFEADELIRSIDGNEVSLFLKKYTGSIGDTEKKIEEESIQIENTLINLMESARRKEKDKVEVPENIKEYFNELVGLENVQIELDKFYKMLRLQNERKQSEFMGEIMPVCNFIIEGGKASGKKTVAKIISQMLFDFGVRDDYEPIVINSRVIIDISQGNKEKGIKEYFAGISDCTVVIDECQNLTNELDNNEILFRRLLSELSEVMLTRKDSLSFVLLGERQAFEKINVIDGTFKDSIAYRIGINAYSIDELMDIAKNLTIKKSLRIHYNAEKTLRHILEIEAKSPDFMNAISINRILDRAAMKLAERYYASDDDSDMAKVTLIKDDFEFEEPDESIEDLLLELELLTGLENVKKEVKKRIEAISVQKKAKEAGYFRSEDNGSLHMVFTGNPGTGKTTVARLIGKIYHHLGVITNGDRFVECTRSDLVGMYVGHTARQVQQKISEAMGGILFIDEAYSLCRDDSDSFGQEAVNELIAGMENNKDNLIVILAGYKDEMADFLKSNPGFTSRIRNYIEFEDYSISEMMNIYKSMVQRRGMLLENNHDGYIEHMLDIRSAVPDFGNARGVRNLFEETLEVMNSRIIRTISGADQVGKDIYLTIKNSDIESVAGKAFENEKTFDELIAELNALTGLHGAKKKVQEIVDDIQVKRYMAEKGIAGSHDYGTLHLVFLGNAGTGKTTVARLIGKIYKQLGILSKNVFIEVGRKDLVAGYTGQTATKVMKKIKEAEGGILFIDEAYSLVNGSQDSFGNEAITTLVAEIENRRNNLMVIVAGYEPEMRKFLDANQGLSSRLSNEIVFDDYSDDELFSIFVGMLEKKGLALENGLDEMAKSMIVSQKMNRKDFGNARGVRNIVENVEKKKNSRIASMLRNGDDVSDEMAITIVESDLMIM